MKKGNRHYDKPIKELKWWLIENQSLVFIGSGILLGLLFGILLVTILEY